jgi:hypothetical protein
MKNKAMSVLGKHELVGSNQFCNGPLQNWILNTHPPVGMPEARPHKRLK